jgi:GT2 family glycosyltransferase
LIGEILSDFDLVITESDGPSGTSTAINTGVRRASGDIVVTVADDMLLGERYLERLVEMYEKHDSDRLAGIGKAGWTDWNRLGQVLITLYRKIFYFNLEPWSINKAGIQNAGNITDPVIAEYITGGGASYKREILSDHPFSHWDGGREVHEDIEICWRLTNEGYHFIADPELPVEHIPGERHSGGFQEGKKKGRNRVRMFAQNGDSLDIPLFMWAIIGKVCAHFIMPVFLERDIKRMWPMGFGMVIGVIQMASLLFGSEDTRSDEGVE